MSTITYWAADLTAAKEWYTDLLGVEPYFERPGGYYEFRIGDYQAELGICDASYAPGGLPAAPGGTVVYWAVDDLPAAVERLLAMGAKEYEPITDRGEGFFTAAVVDPFGNILGVMANPHYMTVLARTGEA
ncbi:VOC family protein [Streptomyces sp. NPDC055078]